VTEHTTHGFKEVILPFAVGVIAGLSSGLFGVGGGIIMVPLFVYLLKIDQKRAHATSLAAVVPIALVGAWGYSSHGNVDLPAVIYVLLGSIFGAMYGARILHRVALPAIQILFAVVLLLSGLRLLWSVEPAHIFHGWGSHLFLIAVGLLSGVISGLLGVGGGLFVVPALIATAGLTSLEARGTSLAVIVGTAFAGAVTHMRRGNVDQRIARWCGLGGIPGAFLGVSLSHDLSEGLVVKALAAVIVLVAVGQLRSARQGLVAG
jgi:uncharacterized membrane protein YfcA